MQVPFIDVAFELFQNQEGYTMADYAALLRDHITLTCRSIHRIFLQVYVPKLQSVGHVCLFLNTSVVSDCRLSGPQWYVSPDGHAARERALATSLGRVRRPRARARPTSSSTLPERSPREGRRQSAAREYAHAHGAATLGV